MEIFRVKIEVYTVILNLSKTNQNENIYLMVVTSSIQSSLINLYIQKCLTQFIKCQKLFDFLDCTHSVRCFQIAFEENSRIDSTIC